MAKNKKAAPAGTGTASNTFDRSKFNQPGRIRVLPFSSTIAAYPMPAPLSDAEILTTAAQLEAHHFASLAEGAAVIAKFKRRGLPILLSWPDGVRVAISCHATAEEGIDIYRAARARIEAGYQELVEQSGGRA